MHTLAPELLVRKAEESAGDVNHGRGAGSSGRARGLTHHAEVSGKIWEMDYWPIGQGGLQEVRPIQLTSLSDSVSQPKWAHSQATRTLAGRRIFLQPGHSIVKFSGLLYNLHLRTHKSVYAKSVSVFARRRNAKERAPWSHMLTWIEITAIHFKSVLWSGCLLGLIVILSGWSMIVYDLLCHKWLRM